jgi:cation transport ATPase
LTDFSLDHQVIAFGHTVADTAAMKTSHTSIAFTSAAASTKHQCDLCMGDNEIEAFIEVITIVQKHHQNCEIS